LPAYVYVHDLDPFIFQISGQFGVRWYGFAYMLGFLAGYGLLLWQIREGLCDLSREASADLVLTVALSGIIGGRLGHVFLWGLRFLKEDPLYVFRIWEGGMSIHGGVVGAILGMLWFARTWDVSFWDLTDAAAFGTPPGLFFGRIANFINGELWGRPTDGHWGVVFPRAPLGPDGDPVPRHPSQLYEAVLEGPALLVFLWMIRSYYDRTGRTSAFFLMGYGVFRFMVEFYRAPAPYVGFEWLGMTRGQIYSLVFILAGMAILYFMEDRSWSQSS